MIASLALSLLAVAQDVPLPPPRRARVVPPPFICMVRRESPLGTIRAQQSVSLAGVADEPLFGWETAFDEDGQFQMSASWSRAPRNYSLVSIMFNLRSARPRNYRLRLQDVVAPGEDDLGLDSGAIPAREGWTYVFTRWGTLTGLLGDSYAPRFVVLGDDRELFRSEPIDPATFRDAREMAMRLESELAPLVADYRNRCTFYPRGGLPVPPQVPG
jgi:hypothetical protein